MKLLFDMAAQTDMMIGILQRMMTEEPERYQRMLSSLVAKAQQVRVSLHTAWLKKIVESLEHWVILTYIIEIFFLVPVPTNL